MDHDKKMNILFLSLFDFDSLEERYIVTDLLRALAERGHALSCISPVERRSGKNEAHLIFGNVEILKPRIGNIQKNGLLEKAVSMLLLESQLLRAIKRHFRRQFDLILYTTPPITFHRIIEYIKRRDGARTYLMLKDIFPQNAVDLGLIRPGGLIHRLFLAKERRLYQISDRIGCMSPANVEFLLKNNPWLNPGRVELCPNTITPLPPRQVDRVGLRAKYGLPLDATVFLYGGNLGRPQGLDFIIQALHTQALRRDRFFVICGNGAEFTKIGRFLAKTHLGNVRLLEFLPKPEFDDLTAVCDVGLIFLDHRFTIPNFPMRLLSYMENSLPVLAATDSSTDIGRIIVENGFGWWCESRRPMDFADLLEKALAMKGEFSRMGRLARAYLEANYQTEISLEAVLRSYSTLIEKADGNDVQTRISGC